MLARRRRVPDSRGRPEGLLPLLISGSLHTRRIDQHSSGQKIAEIRKEKAAYTQ
jgi:hypothetical protein